MLIASDNPQRPMLSLGSTVWSTIPPVPGRPATVAVKADADIPGLKMHTSMTLRKNTDPSLQATYTIDLKFSFADGAPVSGVEDVEPKMRNLGSTVSEAMASVKVKISDLLFSDRPSQWRPGHSTQSRPDTDARLVRLCIAPWR